MNNHKNEIVEELRRSLLIRYSYQIRSGNKINTEFIKLLIEREGIDEVLKAGIILLSEFGNKRQIYLPDIGIRRRPQGALKILFNEILDEGYKDEIWKTVLEMYKRGNKSGSFLIEILGNSVTGKSMLHIENLAKEMEKIPRSSIQGDEKKKFKKRHEKEVKYLLKNFQPPELSLIFSQLQPH